MSEAEREWQFESPAGITDREVGLHALAMQIRYDLTAAQGKLTELMRQVGELDLPEPTESASFMNGPVTADQCESCGVGAGNHAYDCQALHLEAARSASADFDAVESADPSTERSAAA